MLTILAIAVGFSLASLTMLGSDRIRARRLTQTSWMPMASATGSAPVPNTSLGAQPQLVGAQAGRAADHGSHCALWEL
jgi:hypothetical protein